MFRNYSTPAIVIRKTRVGEIHKSLTLMTRGGLIRALAHGAYKIKSRFRIASEPYSYLKVYLYHEPVKDQYKITDIEMIDLFEGIRESLVKFYTASLWAEVTLKSFGGGTGSAEIFELLLDALHCLDECRAGREIMVSIQFLWRFLSIMGYGPALNTCYHCGTAIGQNEASFFSENFSAFLCRGCAGSEALILLPGGRRYLEVTTGRPFRSAARVGLEEESVSALRKILYRFIQMVLEASLNSIKSGAGIL
ncbi:DNA repair protein RecO [subsurface metagenome]